MQNRTPQHDFFFFFAQKPKPAVQRRSSVLDHTCVSLSVGSVMGIKTVLMGLTRVSKLAVVSVDFGSNNTL